MIRIHFNPPNTDEWKKWCKKCSNAQNEINKIYKRGNRCKLKKIYKEQSRIYFDNKAPFYGKCAYCEQEIYSDQNGDIEHYRPYADVRKENNKFEMIGQGKKAKRHPGYYWLGLSWTNFLPSCVLCNRLSSKKSKVTIGKGNRFPVEGFRAKVPGEETKEIPLLINPINEDPSDSLVLMKNGCYDSLNKKGELTIRILGLNDRDLPKQRHEKYEDTKQKILLLRKAIAEDDNKTFDILVKQLKAIKNGKGEFTNVSRKAINDNKNLIKSTIERANQIQKSNVFND